MWEILTVSGDRVASTNDCDDQCTMISDRIRGSGVTQLSFDRYVSKYVDGGEGLKVHISTNNGASYREIAFYSDDNGQDDTQWHIETIDISGYQSNNMKLKFTAINSKNNEIIRVDDITITGSFGGTVTPPASSSFSQTQTLSHTLIDNSDRQENVGTIYVNKNITIETIEVKITLTYTYHGDLVGKLVSPSGESVTILNYPREISSGVHTYMIDLPLGSSFTNFVGDNARGTWKLTMGDYAGADIGTITLWELSITGT